MNEVKWTPEFAIGIDEVDTQHHALIDMINALAVGIDRDHDDSMSRQMIDNLADYVRFHFALEEKLMATGGCDQEFMVRHRGEHGYYRGVLKDFRSDFISGRSRISPPFIDYLVHWLLHHIVTTDREMVAHLHTSKSRKPREPRTMTQEMTDELNASERHLLFELQHANAQLESRLGNVTGELERIRKSLGDALGRIDKLAPNRKT